MIHIIPQLLQIHRWWILHLKPLLNMHRNTHTALICGCVAVWRQSDLQVTENEFDPSLHKGLNCAAAVRLSHSAAASSHPQIYKTSKELEGKYQEQQCKRYALHRCALYVQYFNWASMWRWQLSCYLPPVINWSVVTMEMCNINEPPRRSWGLRCVCLHCLFHFQADPPGHRSDPTSSHCHTDTGSSLCPAEDSLCSENRNVAGSYKKWVRVLDSLK